MSDNKFQLSFSSSDAGLPQSLSVEPISKAKKITNICVWMSAFRIFVGVYAQKYPRESPALMKYGDVVQDLADRGQNWRFYDENFRFLRQTQHSLLSWANVHWELWLRSQHTSQKLPSTMQRAPSTHRERDRKIPFLEATASSFTKERLVLGANLNIPVLSVTVYTLAAT
jgi:hypothetical protein